MRVNDWNLTASSIESAKRAQKGADTAVQSITKAILNCSSDEKKIQLQVKLEAKTKEGEEVKEVIEKLTLREEYTRMTSTIHILSQPSSKPPSLTTI